jgi:TatD DNase family protein
MRLMKIFDTHCHLGGEELLPQALELSQRAFDQGVTGLALISADLESLKSVALLAPKIQAQNPSMTVVFTAGIHPHDSSKISDDVWHAIESHAQSAQAIGETGLDFFYEHSDRASQIAEFDRHIDLAIRLQKPLVIHCRQAAVEIIDRLNSAKISERHKNPGIIHCFTEDQASATTFLDMGFFISFSGILSFKNAEPLRQVARQVPLSQLLIETDSPWLAPVPQRGQRNEPAFVKHVYDCLQGLRSEDPALLQETLWQNSLRVYGCE